MQNSLTLLGLLHTKVAGQRARSLSPPLSPLYTPTNRRKYWNFSSLRQAADGRNGSALFAPFARSIKAGSNAGISLPCSMRQTGKLGVHILHPVSNLSSPHHNLPSPHPFPLLQDLSFYFLFLGCFSRRNFTLSHIHNRNCCSHDAACCPLPPD